MAIISFKHDLIFVKTTKTAGTSIEVELARRLEADAIVTPVIPPVDGHAPRNYRRGVLKTPFYNHMSAQMIRSFIGRERFDRMYRFCVEREPVGKCISHFHMLRNSPDHRDRRNRSLSWSDYVRRGDFPIDIDKYSEVKDGVRILLVNEVIPYEDLQARFDRILSRAGIGGISLETKAKGEYSGAKVVDRNDVTSQERAIIYAAFQDSLTIGQLGDHYHALSVAA